MVPSSKRATPGLIDTQDVVPNNTTLGHEIAGVTDDRSPVAIEPLVPCGLCEPCESGDYNLCVDSSSMIYGIGPDGGMADFM